ncbi:MAG: hypothetical protein CVT88_06405 [Candidatus Altiarchaeales archaeon HGW-Altiarchaeales-1]|nr:MAG: hypothetical protein CVT89_03255 [Candidatus Altiarchaeales archaeon HGW-Altiarchaeales-2]PKP58991.1 MAG: hypothetical protein CVT88_06405 [Candidatus Altiarchaeales archaeon HGW-Altiarchaeales-1]
MNNLFNDLEDDERIVIYALGALNNTPIRSKIKIQKLLFLISNVFKKYKDLLEFEPHLFGPYSERLEYIVQDIQKLGLIEIEGSKYKLTQKGFDLYLHLKPKKDLLKVIEDFKDFLNDLPDDEILAFIYVSYPKYIGESAKWDDLKKDCVEIAISLLKKEKVSFGKAVEISGLSSFDFEELLKKKNIKWKKITSLCSDI